MRSRAAVSLLSGVLLLLDGSLAAPAASGPSVPLSGRAQRQPAGVHHLPLEARYPSKHTRQAFSGDELLLAHLAEGESVSRKYGFEPAAHHRRALLSKRAGTGSIELAGNQLVFYTSLSIGTPPVTYNLNVDTGSSDLVLVTEQSDACAPGSALYCKLTASFYSPNLSSTAVVTGTPVQLEYGTASAEGFVVRDTVTLATNTTIFNNPAQDIAACYNVTHLVASEDQTGLWGMGWQALSAVGSVPFLESLWRAGQLAEPIFAFALADLSLETPRRTRVSQGGTLTVGGTNSSQFSGAINWVPLVENKYWAIKLDDLTVRGTSLGIASDKTIIDTGSNLIAVPEDIADKIYGAIPGSRLYSGVWLYPCSTRVALTFTFGGVSYSLSESNFNRGSYSYTECIGAVFALTVSSSDPRALMIVGTPFLFNHYNAYRFDPPAVGLASIASGVQDSFRTNAIPTSNGTNFSPVPRPTSSNTRGSAGAVSAAGGRAAAGPSAGALLLCAALLAGAL